MKNTFETKRNVWEIVPYKPDRKSAMYEYERGAKYKLYRKTVLNADYNVFVGLFSTKHACKEYAANNDF